MASNLEPPLRGEPLFDEQGNLTIRFAEFLDKLSVQVNESADTIGRSSTLNLGSQIDDLQQQVGSGDDLTWDEDGFTWDLDTLTFDQDEA